MPNDTVRLSQVVGVFGPGAMLDLPDRSVLVQGLDHWEMGGKGTFRTIEEPRLARLLHQRLADDGRVVGDQPPELRTPPLDPGDPRRLSPGIKATVFPRWFACDALDGDAPNRRRLVPFHILTPPKRLEHLGEDGKRRRASPIRFVCGCEEGHLQDIEWRKVVHTARSGTRGASGEARCAEQMWLVDGVSGDPRDTRVACDCGASVTLEELFQRGRLGPCPGRRPWIGDAEGDVEPCTAPDGLRLLTRSATNTYFPQVASVISLPQSEDRLSRLIEEFWSVLQQCGSAAEVSLARRFNPALGASLAGFPDDDVFDRLRTFSAGTTAAVAEAEDPRIAEYEVLASGRGLIVRPVGPFIADLLDRFWAVRNGARLRQRSLPPLEQEARRAYFGLCGADMLGVLWHVYERQIADRLAAVTDALWLDGTFGDEALTWSGKLALALRSCSGSSRINRNPSASRFRLDDVYDAIGRPYEALRRALPPPARDAFDDTFLRVIFDIYDPLSALASAFDPLRGEGRIRIARGTGHRAAEAEVMDDMAADWARRQYGPEEQPWLAWLLRHALPEHEDDQGQGRIRLMPGALDLAGGRRERWTHVALDEAQDLSVVEASLLPSFVHPDGAVTVSADFRQAVTATKGMEDGGALAVGCPLRDGRAITPFRFGRNMRQTREIGRFLQGFYLSAFGESAPFDVDDERTGPRPRLILAPSAEQARRIRQVLNSLRQGGSVATVAVLQVNEDERTLLSLRGDLERAGLQLAPIFDADARAGIVTTSVERIKGLEFDACIVLGLEGAENAALNFTLNRAYVGLSRATQRLALVCEHMPALLRRVDRALYDLPS